MIYSNIGTAYLRRRRPVAMCALYVCVRLLVVLVCLYVLLGARVYLQLLHQRLATLHGFVASAYALRLIRHHQGHRIMKLAWTHKAVQGGCVHSFSVKSICR